MDNKKKILVTGAAGFIGSHLCRYLKNQGHWVRGVDIVAPEYDLVVDDFKILNLREMGNCLLSVADTDLVYALAADMGGMGYIGNPQHDALIMYNNTMINFQTFEACRRLGPSWPISYRPSS